MAQFYNKYANGLIQKLMNSDEELSNMEKDKKKEEKESESGKSSKSKTTKRKEESKSIISNSKKNQEKSSFFQFKRCRKRCHLQTLH